LKKAKKGKCYNCKKTGHYAKDCWAPGGGAEGKGPKKKEKGGKGKEKDVTAKVEEKDNDDGMWMATTDLEEKLQEQIENGCEMWMTDEISTECDVLTEYLSDTTNSNVIDDSNNLDDSLIYINEDVGVNIEGDEVVDEFDSRSLEEESTIDNGEKAKTYIHIHSYNAS
jgi:Zinc knuckle